MMHDWGAVPSKTWTCIVFEPVMLLHYFLFSEACMEVQTGLVLLLDFLLDMFACTQRFVPFASLHTGMKLLEHAVKVVERIFEHKIRQQIEVNDMQFRFMKGKGTTDAFLL